jgi:hypothetical protein
MSLFEELGDVDVALYRRLVHRRGATLDDVADELGRRSADLEKPAIRLTEMGLVTTEDGARYTAVSPMLAEATMLGAEDLELGARRAALEARRNSIRQLVPHWDELLTSAGYETAVDIVTDQAKIGNVLMHYADRCREELLSVAAGRLPKTRIDSRTRIANLYSLRRGIRTRALYQHSALRDRNTHS